MGRTGIGRGDKRRECAVIWNGTQMTLIRWIPTDFFSDISYNLWSSVPSVSSACHTPLRHTLYRHDFRLLAFTHLQRGTGRM